MTDTLATCPWCGQMPVPFFAPSFACTVCGTCLAALLGDLSDWVSRSAHRSYLPLTAFRICRLVPSGALCLPDGVTLPFSWSLMLCGEIEPIPVVIHPLLPPLLFRYLAESDTTTCGFAPAFGPCTLRSSADPPQALRRPAADPPQALR